MTRFEMRQTFFQKMNLKHGLKRWLFPGLDLHTRCRYRWLPPLFTFGPIETLDVGFGNGAFSLAAARKGNHVTAVSMDQKQVDKAKAFFGPRREQITFMCLNAYKLRDLGRQFDQIICLETLEHIRDDQGMVHLFWDLLRPGGTLQLCCPNAAHPEHNLGRVNGPEDGGHVRDGYTLESYRKLLEPVGFVIERHLGLGSHILTTLDRPIRQIRNRFGDVAALPFFAINWPVTYVFDRPNPPMPYSLHVVARKPNLSEP
jgi:2-polyprenyl-3-methyl-5-hydroxy-6-metoxy-1,4-benzoquinol methylase